MAHFTNNVYNDDNDSRSLSGDSSPPISSDGESETSLDEIHQQQLNLNSLENDGCSSGVGGNRTNDKNKDDEEENKQQADNENDEYIPGTFEGPEKNLCVEFKPNIGHEKGLRQLNRSNLDEICEAAKCTIMSKISNQYFDAYVLSESSLFIYKNKLIMKTCGTTLLLKCLIPLIKYTEKLGLEIDWLSYSRKNYLFPKSQLYPHCHFENEFQYIKQHPMLSSKIINGEGYVLGPITNDHWLTYVCDKPNNIAANSYNNSLLNNNYNDDDITINIMMFDLDEKIASQFYKENYSSSLSNDEIGKAMTMTSGISTLVPGAFIDDRAFEPCGYSMNSMLHDTYSTIHITPEKECSYASFETNHKLKSYNSLIKNVINIFKPKRFLITMISDENALFNKNTLTECPIKTLPIIDIPSSSSLSKKNDGHYVRTSKSSTSIAGDVFVQMGNWELKYENKNKGFNRQRTLSF
jgi:S-adenosylmethionine decarboxylase